MRIQNALGVSCSPGSIAKAGCIILIDIHPIGVFVARGQEVLVEHKSGDFSCCFFITHGHKNEGIDSRQLLLDPLNDRQERLVKKDDPIFRVVDDIDKLFREKARIDRVTYHSTTGNAKVAF